jgi:hypothetical protein
MEFWLQLCWNSLAVIILCRDFEAYFSVYCHELSLARSTTNFGTYLLDLRQKPQLALSSCLKLAKIRG